MNISVSGVLMQYVSYIRHTINRQGKIALFKKNPRKAYCRVVVCF